VGSERGGERNRSLPSNENGSGSRSAITSAGALLVPIRGLPFKPGSRRFKPAARRALLRSFRVWRVCK
jgi:hypothetical protein